MGSKFTDDFLDDVLECDQTLYLAVFVYHQPYALLGFLKMLQLLKHWRTLGDEIGFRQQVT